MNIIKKGWKSGFILAVVILLVGAGNLFASSFGEGLVKISDQEIEEAMKAMDVKKYNALGLKINYATYRRYNLWVYGNPFGTYSFGYSNEMEYRYLGYDYSGVKFTNDLFPNDATASDPRDRHYVGIQGARDSWKKTTPEVADLMFRQHVIDDGKQLDYSLYDIFKGRCKTIDEMKDYVYLNYPATIVSNGSTTTRHIR